MSLHRAGRLSCTGCKKTQILSPPDDVSFLPISIIFIHDPVFLSVNCIFSKFVCYVFLVERINVPMWITLATQTPMHEEHHTDAVGWKPPHRLTTTGAVFYYYQQQRYFIVGWFCCFGGTVTGQWLCVFVHSRCVGQWTCWICKWLLVSYTTNNGKRIKWEK